MRLEQYEFTATVKGKIVEMERNCAKLCAELNEKFGSGCRLELVRTGYDSFVPYYCSAVSLTFSGKDRAAHNRRFVIWECRRELLGMTVRWNVPGSKVSGEWIDESFGQLAKKVEEYCGSFI